MPVDTVPAQTSLSLLQEAGEEAVAMRAHMEKVTAAYNLLAFRQLRRHAPEVARLAVETFGSHRAAAAYMTVNQRYLGGIPILMVAEGPQGQEKVTTWMNRVLHCCA